jgi:hypothetical protein
MLMIRYLGNHRNLKRLLPAIACLALFALPCFAQSTASIVGTVKDSSGAVIPGATVILTNPATADKRTAVTEGNGAYRFLNIAPAPYRLDFELKGFKRLTREPVTVQVESTVLIDAVLEIGNVSEVVEVTAETPLLDTQTSTLSHVVEAKTVQEMPINGRNVMNLLALVPGVVPQGATVGQTIVSNQSAGHTNNWAWNNYQIGGGVAGHSSAYLDGAPTIALGNNTVVLIATQDAIQEFRVATNNVGVEYGRFGGGVVNMATKSGTNEFHGSAYEYFRNRILNANDFFANQAGKQRPAFNQNQYGATLGGPIRKDKTFFFFTWEQFRAKIGSTVTVFVPTDAQRAGDFSASLGASTGVINPCTGDFILKGQIFDPLTTKTVDGKNCRMPFAGNKIPTNRIDGAANVMANVLKYWPSPNASNPGYNYAGTPNPGGKQQQFNARVDENLSDRHRLFARFTYWTVNDTPMNRFNNLTAGAGSNQATHQAVLGNTYSFSPTLVMENRFSYSRAYYDDNPPSVGLDLSQYGPAWATLNSLVTFRELVSPGNMAGSMTGWPGMNVTTRHFRNTWALSSNLTKVSGRHTIKFGGEIRLMDYIKNENNSPSGAFNFTSAFTSFDGTTGANSGGVPYASFMLGYPASGSILATKWSSMYSWYQGYYVGDIFQVNSKLTLNYGVRWEMPGAFAERNDNATVLLPDKTDPLSSSTGLSLKGQLALVDSTDWPNRTTQKPRYNLFAPRVGFAFRFTNSTVVRAGYGLSYLPMDLGINGSGSLPSYSPINSATTDYVPAGNNPYIPLNSLSNPFPAGGVAGTVQQSILQPAGRAYNLASLEGLSISGGAPYESHGYAQQWNLNIQHELNAGLMFEIGYSGAKGTHLPTGFTRQLNQLDSKYYSQGSALLTTVTNPMAGKLNATSPYNKATITQGQLWRPYPQFGNVLDTAALIGSSNYHSMQLRLEKRFGAAGIVTGNYTWAKFMGNVDSGMTFLEANAVGAYQDFNNIGAERSLTSFDIPHRLMASYVLELPIGKGKRFAAGVTGPVDKLISGWSVNGIVALQTGYPLAMKAQPNTLATFGAGTIRPNRVAGCDPVKTGSAQSRITQWFNTACFSQPGAFSLGNVSRTEPVLRTHGVNNVDFTLSKTTVITERVKLQFKTEFFNLFNRVQFRVNNTTMGVGAFGTVSLQQNQPRLIQFALRLVF